MWKRNQYSARGPQMRKKRPDRHPPLIRSIVIFSGYTYPEHIVPMITMNMAVICDDESGEGQAPGARCVGWKRSQRI